MVNKVKYNCVFGGGGVRGMCYVGALKAIEELDIELEAVAGSSVGAVFAALYAAGYNYLEIKELFFDFNFNMFRDININLFNTDISLSKGEIFLDWLREKIGKKVLGDKYTPNSKVRFKDLSKNLHVLTLDINTNSPYIFSKENTPNEEVAFAVRTSASLPGLMKPINMGESILVDGDLIKSWPAWEVYDFLNTPGTRLLEFRLEGTRDGSEAKNPMEYISSIINTIWYLCTENVFKNNQYNDRYDYIVIDAKDVILFDFSIEKHKREELSDKGYITTKNYFTKTLPKKKERILSLYINLSVKLQQLYKFVNKNDADGAMFILNEILSTMYDDTKYIDISIYEKLRELKDTLTLNVKKLFLARKIDNEKQIKERVEFIIMLVNERISDLENYIKVFGNKT